MGWAGITLHEIEMKSVRKTFKMGLWSNYMTLSIGFRYNKPIRIGDVLYIHLPGWRYAFPENIGADGMLKKHVRWTIRNTARRRLENGQKTHSGPWKGLCDMERPRDDLNAAKKKGRPVGSMDSDTSGYCSPEAAESANYQFPDQQTPTDLPFPSSYTASSSQDIYGGYRYGGIRRNDAKIEMCQWPYCWYNQTSETVMIPFSYAPSVMKPVAFRLGLSFIPPSDWKSNHAHTPRLRWERRPFGSLSAEGFVPDEVRLTDPSKIPKYLQPTNPAFTWDASTLANQAYRNVPIGWDQNCDVSGDIPACLRLQNAAGMYILKNNYVRMPATGFFMNRVRYSPGNQGMCFADASLPRSMDVTYATVAETKTCASQWSTGSGTFAEWMGKNPGSDCPAPDCSQIGSKCSIEAQCTNPNGDSFPCVQDGTCYGVDLRHNTSCFSTYPGRNCTTFQGVWPEAKYPLTPYPLTYPVTKGVARHCLLQNNPTQFGALPQNEPWVRCWPSTEVNVPEETKIEQSDWTVQDPSELATPVYSRVDASLVLSNSMVGEPTDVTITITSTSTIKAMARVQLLGLKDGQSGFRWKAPRNNTQNFCPADYFHNMKYREGAPGTGYFGTFRGNLGPSVKTTPDLEYMFPGFSGEVTYAGSQDVGNAYMLRMFSWELASTLNSGFANHPATSGQGDSTNRQNRVKNCEDAVALYFEKDIPAGTEINITLRNLAIVGGMHPCSKCHVLLNAGQGHSYHTGTGLEAPTLSGHVTPAGSTGIFTTKNTPLARTEITIWSAKWGAPYTGKDTATLKDPAACLSFFQFQLRDFKKPDEEYFALFDQSPNSCDEPSIPRHSTFDVLRQPLFGGLGGVEPPEIVAARATIEFFAEQTDQVDAPVEVRIKDFKACMPLAVGD